MNNTEKYNEGHYTFFIRGEIKKWKLKEGIFAIAN